jgi:hypothetical protein
MVRGATTVEDRRCCCVELTYARSLRLAGAQLLFALGLHEGRTQYSCRTGKAHLPPHATRHGPFLKQARQCQLNAAAGFQYATRFERGNQSASRSRNGGTGDRGSKCWSLQRNPAPAVNSLPQPRPPVRCRGIGDIGFCEIKISDHYWGAPGDATRSGVALQCPRAPEAGGLGARPRVRSDVNAVVVQMVNCGAPQPVAIAEDVPARSCVRCLQRDETAQSALPLRRPVGRETWQRRAKSFPVQTEASRPTLHFGWLQSVPVTISSRIESYKGCGPEVVEHNGPAGCAEAHVQLKRTSVGYLKSNAGTARSKLSSWRRVHW